MYSLKVAAFFLSVSIIVLFVSLALIAIDMWYGTADTNTQGQFCLPCDDVERHSGVPNSFVKRSSMNSSVCCAKDNGNINKVMQQVVKTMTSSLTSEHPPTHGSRHLCAGVLPMIKLVGHDKMIPGLDSHTVEWDVASKMTIQQDVDYGNGRIRILTPGTYFVYSSLAFRCDRNINDKGPLTTFQFHRMMQQKDLGGQETLIDQRIFPYCQTTAIQTITTSHLEAVIKVNKGDHLYVHVHNTADILPVGPASNYFGAHIIP